MTRGENRWLGRFFSDRLFRSSFWLFVAFAVSGLANYGYQVAMGRFLSPETFTFLNALLGVFVILSVPVSTLLMVISRRTAEYYATGNQGAVGVFFRQMNRRGVAWGAVALAGWCLLSGVLADSLRAPSVTPVLLLGGALFLALMVPVNTAVLQGLQSFRWFAFFQGLGGPLRFVLCVTPALLGWGVNGVLIGLIATHGLTWLLAWGLVRPRMAGGETGPLKPLAWGESLPVFMANLAFALMTQMDLILVNRLFSPQEAAQYAAAAVLGRTIIYVPGTVVLAMFPMVTEHQARRVDARPLFLKSALLTLLLSGAGALLFFFAPAFVLEVLFGVRYLASAGLLRFFGVALLPMAILMVLFQYLAAQGRRDFSWVLWAGALLEMGWIVFFHGSLSGVLWALGTTGTLMCLVGFLRLKPAGTSSGVDGYACAGSGHKNVAF